MEPTAVKPQYVNDQPFSSEEFPKVVGFCDRDNSTYIRNNGEESYLYKFAKETIYNIRRKENRWEIIEFAKGHVHRINAANKLGEVLLHALSFSDKDKTTQEKRVNIIFPVSSDDLEKALAIMYDLGGYPASITLGPTEYAFIAEKFGGVQLEYLAYSYVPVEYISWLRDELKQADLIGQIPNRTIWVYKK